MRELNNKVAIIIVIKVEEEGRLQTA